MRLVIANWVTSAQNGLNLDEFQGKENEDGSISQSYRSYGRKVWDSALAPGSPGVLERATSALLVPYILAVKAEGFGFNYTRWQQVNDATREQRQRKRRQLQRPTLRRVMRWHSHQQSSCYSGAHHQRRGHWHMKIHARYAKESEAVIRSVTSHYAAYLYAYLKDLKPFEAF